MLSVLIFLGEKVQELIITSVLSVDMSYTNEQSLGRNGVETSLSCVPTEKALRVITCHYCVI